MKPYFLKTVDGETYDLVLSDADETRLKTDPELLKVTKGETEYLIPRSAIVYLTPKTNTGLLKQTAEQSLSFPKVPD